MKKSFAIAMFLILTMFIITLVNYRNLESKYTIMESDFNNKFHSTISETYLNIEVDYYKSINNLYAFLILVDGRLTGNNAKFSVSMNKLYTIMLDDSKKQSVISKGEDIGKILTKILNDYINDNNIDDSNNIDLLDKLINSI